MTWKLPIPAAPQLPSKGGSPPRPQPPPGELDRGGAAPVRLSWRDFPPEYISALRTAAGPSRVARLGPMSWNDARFSQREFYRLVATLRRNVEEGDSEAFPLDDIARQLRCSVPRCEEDLTQHWFILKANPLVKAVRAQQEEGR